MRRIDTNHDGDLVVEHEAVEINATIIGDLILGMGAEVIMLGAVMGQVRVSAGDLRLHGTVYGDILNSGGVIHIVGLVKGSVHRFGGITHISAVAPSSL
jgi:hypothetical protein